MKICLIADGNLWESPYVDIYTDFLSKYQIDYDLITWDRDESEKGQPDRFSYKPKSNKLGKFIGYYKYARFIRQHCQRHQYDKIIVFGQAVGIFLDNFLTKKNRKKFLLDIRDVGIEQQPLFKRKYDKLVKASKEVVISSPGFRSCMSGLEKAAISHNFQEKRFIQALDNGISKNKSKVINVLTIGILRDFASNSEIINSLSNHDEFLLTFAGSGYSKETLEDFAKEKGVKNIIFTGRYDKNDEPYFMDSATFINIYMPNKITHNTLMANRFYGALIHRKPIIAFKNGHMGSLVEHYNLGVAINNTENLSEVLKRWIDNYDADEFNTNCKELMTLFMNDQEDFKNKLKNFLDIPLNEE